MSNIFIIGFIVITQSLNPEGRAALPYPVLPMEKCLKFTQAIVDVDVKTQDPNEKEVTPEQNVSQDSNILVIEDPIFCSIFRLDGNIL